MENSEESIVLCRCVFHVASLLKDFIVIAAAKNSSCITFAPNEIYAGNSDNYIAGRKRGKVNTGKNQDQGITTHYRFISYSGSEIGYKWEEDISEEERNITVMFELSQVTKHLGRCIQKAKASLNLVRVMDPDVGDLYFFIFGDGLDNEGGGSVSVTRCNPEPIPHPDLNYMDDPDYTSVIPEIKFLDVPVVEMIQGMNKMFGKNELVEINILSTGEYPNGNGIQFCSPSGTKVFGNDQGDTNGIYYLPGKDLSYIISCKITTLSVLHVYWEEGKYLKMEMFTPLAGEVGYYLFPPQEDE